MNKIRRKTMPTVFLLLTLVFFVFGTAGCEKNYGNIASGKDRIISLANKSYFFKQTPKELYLGKSVQESFSDQGVTVKYLESFNDGQATYLYFDVIDSSGNLFSKGSDGFDFSLDHYDFSEKTGETESKMYDLISYNEKTRTATIGVEYKGPLENNDIYFHIYSMSGNQKKINTTLEDIDLYKRLKETTGEFEIEKQFLGHEIDYGLMNKTNDDTQGVEMPDFKEGHGNMVYRLKLDALSIPIKDEEGNHIADITNIGWKDGWLHIQVNPDNNMKWDSITSLNLKSNKTGSLLYSPFNFSFGERQDQEELNDYYEYVFFVGDITKENLSYSISFKNTTYQATCLKGDWKIQFGISDTLEKIFL